MWFGPEGMGWGMMCGGIWMMLFPAAMIGLIVWAVLRFTRRGTPGHNGPSQGRTPLDIAKERYARGEIDSAEFEKIKKDLA